MRRETAALVALTLCACTSVSTVTVSVTQLQALSGLGPEEERGFVAQGDSETLDARGSDEVRLLLTMPGADGARHAEQGPWGKLYTLRWGTAVTLTRSQVDDPHVVTTGALVSDITGGEIQRTRVSAGKTTALVVGLVLGGAAIILGGLALAAYEITMGTSGTSPAARSP
jgi:hypothetical protein